MEISESANRSAQSSISLTQTVELSALLASLQCPPQHCLMLSVFLMLNKTQKLLFNNFQIRSTKHTLILRNKLNIQIAFVDNEKKKVYLWIHCIHFNKCNSLFTIMARRNDYYLIFVKNWLQQVTVKRSHVLEYA